LDRRAFVDITAPARGVFVEDKVEIVPRPRAFLASPAVVEAVPPELIGRGWASETRLLDRSMEKGVLM
jgi:hypothetical protein